MIGTPEALPRILLVNTVALNGGDAAILLGQVHALREAFGGRVDITIADDAPEIAARLYPDLQFTAGLHAPRPARGPRVMRRLLRSLRRRRIASAIRLLRVAPTLAHRLLDPDTRDHVARIRAADAVVATGGTYLVEHYNIPRRLHELQAAQALGRPTYLYTQSLGPFRSRRNRRLTARVLSRAVGIFVRDELSRHHIAELGVPPDRVTVCPDAAFALADTPPGGDARRAARAAASEGGRLRVAVSVRSWTHCRTRPADAGQEAYCRAVADAVRYLHERGAEVTFVSTCQGVPEYWTDDSRLARALSDDRLRDLDRLHVDTAFRRPEQLIDHLRGFDLAVATRMHFAIFALIAGVPVVPIAYEFKTAELFAGLGLADLVEDIETITSAGLRARIAAALDARTALRQRITRIVPELRGPSAAPAYRIRERLAAPREVVPSVRA